MPKRKSDFDLPKYDDLFSTQEERDDAKLDKIRDIPLELIVVWEFCTGCRDASTFKLWHISFNEFIHNFRDLGCPNFESVRRTRQMVQSRYPELGCSPKARRARSRGRKAYEKYAKEAAENGKG